jgi:Rod binding domain-containing protein
VKVERGGLPHRAVNLEPKEHFDRSKLEKAARDFEAVLIGQFFRIMRSTVQSDGIIGRSFQRRVYEEMIQDEFAKSFAERGGFGMQELLIEKFQGVRSASPDVKRIDTNVHGREAARGNRAERTGIVESEDER